MKEGEKIKVQQASRIWIKRKVKELGWPYGGSRRRSSDRKQERGGDDPRNIIRENKKQKEIGKLDRSP